MWTTPRLPGRLVHFAHFAGVEPQRLFAHDVLAGLRGGDGHLAMREIRRGDHHGVDFRIGAKLVEVGRDLFDLPLAAAAFQQRGIGIASGNKLARGSSRIAGT